MTHAEYYRRAKELLQMEAAVVESIALASFEGLIGLKQGAELPEEKRLPYLVARHQEIVARAAALGDEFLTRNEVSVSGGSA